MIISKTYQKRNSVLFSSNIIFLQMYSSTKAKQLAISTIGFISPVHADWFQIDNIKANLITVMYKLVNENLVFLSLTVGNLGTAGEVRLVETSQLLMAQTKTSIEILRDEFEELHQVVKIIFNKIGLYQDKKEQ